MYIVKEKIKDLNSLRSKYNKNKKSIEKTIRSNNKNNHTKLKIQTKATNYRLETAPKQILSKLGFKNKYYRANERTSVNLTLNKSKIFISLFSKILNLISVNFQII